MNITPEQFMQHLKEGKTERELNLTEHLFIDELELKKLTSKGFGLTHKEAINHLQTDWSNGFTICQKCGSFYHLGRGFTKHLSNGCLYCEGDKKHMVYHVNASKPSEGGFPARDMCIMFDDGMHYTKSKLEPTKYKTQIKGLKNLKSTK